MKCLMNASVLLVVCFIVNINLFASAAVSQTLPNPLRKPGGCYEENTGHLKNGETITVSGKCERAECAGEAITYASCGSVSVTGGGCHVSAEDLSKPYPECCPRPVCTKANKR